MKTATLKKSTERLDDGTLMPFKIVVAGCGSELYATRADATARVEELRERGFVVTLFA